MTSEVVGDIYSIKVCGILSDNLTHPLTTLFENNAVGLNSKSILLMVDYKWMTSFEFHGS